MASPIQDRLSEAIAQLLVRKAQLEDDLVKVTATLARLQAAQTALDAGTMTTTNIDRLFQLLGRI